MKAVLHKYIALGTMIDETHALFRRWDREGTFYPPLNAVALERAKLAVHEWLANLIQHADFDGREPEIVFNCEVSNGRLRCTIEDNSIGYDIACRPDPEKDILKVFPERGMGLAFLEACTEELSYRKQDSGRHLLEFYVSLD